ncbi:transporter substrate-binding domain-containing protein, partial [Akkermansia muciniphila]|uniref:transporter substrate-binding domain-containing protein n=1 Tax=Akkermansia muciniphila TaxID=239935 RepID=UPI00122EE10F
MLASILKEGGKSMKRKRFLSFLMVLLLLPSLLLFTPVKAKEEKVIKVGFPSFQNLSEVDEKGNPSGYLYDYLKEIAKYTGWKLEFVTADNSNADILNLNDMLANGEIDLMGGMIQNEATSQLYDFPEYDCGFSYATLQVLQNNEKYDFLDYQSLNGMRVGTLRNAANIQKSLDDFCELNDIEVEKVLFDTQADILNALESGQIDALLLKDLGLEPERRIVAKFAGTPFYFAVPKGRTDLIRELNSAMDRILNIDPYFSTKLYHKYFAGTSTHVFFSEEEKAYLAKTAEVKVAILENDRPFGYLENGEWHGISFDFLKYVSQNTGLQFTFVKAKDETEALRMVRDGEADLFASARLHEALHQDKDLMFTATYLSTQNILVKNKKVTETDLSSSRLALPQGVVVSSDLLNENHTYYPTLKDCIDAVNSGKADYTYGNSYSIEQIIRRPAYQNLLLVPMNDSGLQFAMAMSSQADTSLLNLLNKAIATVPNSTLQTLIFENTAKSGNDISLFDFIASHPTESILIISLFSLIVILIIAALAVVRLRHARQEALSDERYRILENITGEYVFEYDIEKDSMSYSEKYANDFGKSRVVKNYAQDHSPSAMRFKELVIQKLHTEAFP